MTCLYKSGQALLEIVTDTTVIGHVKTIFEKERYILSMDMYCFRVAITQVRFNVLPLKNNLRRYSDRIQDKQCPFCKTKIENERHFLLECSMYTDLRHKFLNITNNHNFCLIQMLTAQNNDHMYRLSRYVFHAMNRRKLAM